MKAIAEYFRDLASEDRYFGAEPPQPDAAMLHRIAEREIQRRVEARVSENSVVLRAEEDAPEAEEMRPRITMPAAEDETRELPVQRPALRAAEEGAPGVESVADRLVRLRAASQAQEAEAEGLPAASGAIEAEMPDLTDLTLDFSSESDLGEDLIAAGSRTAASLMAEAEALATSDEASEPPEATLAKVAEVAPHDASEVPAGEHADTSASESPNGWEVRRRSRQMERRRARRAAREAEAAAAKPASAAPAEVPNLALADRVEPQPAPQSVADTGFSFGALEDSLAGFEAEARGELAREAAEAAPAAEAEAGSDVQSLIARMTAQAAPVAEPGPPRRVIRILREEAPAAPAARGTEGEAGGEAEAETDSMIASLLGALGETKETPEPAMPRLSLGKPAPAAEAAQPDLPAETSAPARAAEAVAESAVETAAPARPRRPERSGAVTARPAPLRPLRERADAAPAAPAAQVSVERLIRQVGSEMEEPALRRRTSTIAHLKAAVAATVAERMIPGLRREPKDETVVYRNDLADAVSAEDEGRQAAGGRVAPLVLVSSQRVERAAPLAAPAAVSPAPMRPRRVSSSVLAEVVTPEPLAARGASLSIEAATELLERAAQSILASAEEPVFTRSQLMREAQLEARGFSRDEALIAFGTLLREGRILRASRGLFTLAEDGAAA
jgi:hypothetical protein